MTPTTIMRWARRIEHKLGLSAANWWGPRAVAPTSAQAGLLQLQAFVHTWAECAEPNSRDAVFRKAVAHGVNVQYEALLAKEDPVNADAHLFWVRTESSRASACLDLLRSKPQGAPH